MRSRYTVYRTDYRTGNRDSIGGILLWMAMGHFHGMHGEARPAKAVAKTQAYHQEEGAAAEADPGGFPEEEMAKIGSFR